MEEKNLRLHKLVHLVPHLGSGQVVAGQVRVLAGSAHHTVQLLLGTAGVHQEAHAAGQVALLVKILSSYPSIKVS